MIINKDKSGIHFHATHNEVIFIIGSCLIIFLLTFGLLYYKYYLANYFDSSLNGSETVENQQNTIPADVKQNLDQKESTRSGLTNLTITSINFRVPILMYHYIEYVQDKNDKKRILLNTPPDILDLEIKTLSDAGFTFMTNSELEKVIDSKSSLPSKPILLTFDDGYRDFYTDAFPILKKYHAKATIYIISGFLNKPNHLLTNQVEEIIQSGLVEVGAHTVHHVWLKGSKLDLVSTEIFQSKVFLEQQFHVPVLSFAYPFGAFDQQAVDIVKAAGFLSATSTIPGTTQNQNNKYFLFRLRPGMLSGPDLINWIARQ